MKNDQYEVVCAVVDSGFAEDVMEAARACGARGGTIVNARGVANEEAAAFFGISLHTEKELVLIVVPKTIKDDVLTAVYRELGMAKKAHGIAFSLPVTDIAGLVEQESAEKKSDSDSEADP